MQVCLGIIIIIFIILIIAGYDGSDAYKSGAGGVVPVGPRGAGRRLGNLPSEWRTRDNQHEQGRRAYSVGVKYVHTGNAVAPTHNIFAVRLCVGLKHRPKGKLFSGVGNCVLKVSESDSTHPKTLYSKFGCHSLNH